MSSLGSRCVFLLILWLVCCEAWWCGMALEWSLQWRKCCKQMATPPLHQPPNAGASSWGPGGRAVQWRNKMNVLSLWVQLHWVELAWFLFLFWAGKEPSCIVPQVLFFPLFYLCSLKLAGYGVSFICSQRDWIKWFSYRTAASQTHWRRVVFTFRL